MNYIPLHVKTSYSLLTSLNDIKKMILFCKENNIDKIAITDTNMYGVMEFYKECINNGIKPIIGLEVKIDENIILLYAKNYSGYQNLTRLIYIMQNNQITLDILKCHSENLICVSNKEIFNDLKNIYADIYLGYKNALEKDTTLTDKTVYINEILCMKKEDIPYLKYLYLIKENKKIKDEFKYEIDDNCYFDFNEIDYKNALEITEKCNVEFHQNKSLMPKYDVDNSKEYLFELCKKGLYKRLDGKVTKTYYDRLLYELDVINEMGFNDYFLVVWDYVKYSKKNNILVGPGRGSAAGSLVSYTLGITDVDPIKYDLLFERFLNKERITMPDIDIDFESNHRGDVVNYVINKYGKKRVVPIITFTTLSGKQVLRDIGRIYDIDTTLLDKLTKFIDINMTLTEALDNTDLRRYLEEIKELDNIYKISLKLEGLKRQISVHAAGIIISACNLDSYIPLQKYEDYYLSGYSMEHLEGLGLIKMDFLGLKNLTMIDNILKRINMNFKDIPIDDKDALKLFYNATTCGIFQFESSGMKNFLKKLKPTTIDDIIAAIALFRPGPSDNIDSYIRRKNGLERINYIDDSLSKVLSKTYGIIIYQEQIIMIANIMAGYGYAEADVLRRAMSKKKKEVMLKEREKFVKRSIERGYKESVAEKTYDFILKFANYGFNKAHSVAYSIIALKMAYLKVKYSKEFLSSLLTNVIGSDTKTKEYIDECKKMDVNILKPSINYSEYNYISEADGIRFSLATIRNVGSITCKEIVNERKNGLFVDFCDFVKRTYGKSVNKKTIESLIDADAFSEFGYNHKTLYNNMDAVINYASLANDLDESLIEKPVMEVFDEYTPDELTEKELNVFNLYLSNHPVTKYKKNYDNIVDASNIKDYFDKKINLVVLIDRIKVINTKNGKKMAFITVSDEYDTIDVIVFPNEINLINDLKNNDIVLLRGKVEKRMSKYQVLLENITKL
ncbi:dNA polymerase III alpha subunit [Clostridium sp. CAG:1193]|nr:dNA polymerase III alpha subunit [Clostridium sp. CAG:1193]